MSIQSQEFARMRRVYAIDLTPWCRAAAGDTSTVDLPRGYRILGDARRPSGPFRLTLRRGTTLLMDQWVGAAKDVPTWLQILSDLAFIDERERRGVTVTTDREGFVTSIEDTQGVEP